ncbi:acyl-CoA synthetase [Bradyrhizobium tropiciagri]|uniref:acyl-CoA synthetase n=1 Tax=Bradyrhizobium tropiciagri TaxID=312253 RepID=UPI001BA6DA00|nr:acyl-CoA synthetase [Bradyrhizobium tropiciagri]MBR0898979.1 acyl-CoA synthetase [Bradyrhizobium tropiciagri]
MHPQIHAKMSPNKPAVVMVPGGEIVTFRQLEDRSNKAAHYLRSCGLTRGDTIALCLENNPIFFEIVWAAQKSGLYFVCISSRLTAGEIEYIVRDSGARLLITSKNVACDTEALAKLLSDIALSMICPCDSPYVFWQAATEGLPSTPIADQSAGADMLYSSGTTGKPKGIRSELPDNEAINAITMMDKVGALFGVNQESVYLCPAPLYHSAPLRWTMCVQKAGGTAIVLEHFDAELALVTIERHKVTIAQFVPTHFVRMLKLPSDVRSKHDVSSLRCAIHSAAPCPVQIKEAMIDWWGPVLQEYYSCTEGIGFTMISSEEWLLRKGSVGKAVVGNVKICRDDGHLLPPRQEGTIYFEGGLPLSYHNDPERTASALNALGWATVGDVGWVDEDGYLYLTDRKSFMIISGGVNIYPQEIENLLTTHPRVMDAAVIGAPDEEMGERVVAVIQPMDWTDANPEFAGELTGWMRERLSGVKLPRQIDFMKELPRHPTGKLYKRLLRDSYWGKADSRIVG